MKDRVVTWLLLLTCGQWACQPTTEPTVRAIMSVREQASVESATRAEAGEPVKDDVGPSPCPKGSVLVDGDYCPRVSQVCLQWVTRKGEALPEAAPADGESGRCGTFSFPTVCLGKKIHVRFCINKYELPNIEGQPPMSWLGYYDVVSECQARGERICEKSEWTFACEGPNMQPLPYGDGYHRNSNDCNVDRPLPDEIKNASSISNPSSREGIILDSLRTLAGSRPNCVSPFGVFDLVGNIDEFVHYPQGHVGSGEPDDKGPYTSELVGGHYFGVRNACRPMTAHDERFQWYETGGRCCSDPRD